MAEGETIKLEKLDTSKGEEVVFSDVLLVSDDSGLKLGLPKIEGAKVSAKVVKNGRTRKVIVFKYRAKKRRKKKAGHRQHFTEVQITKISA